MTKFAEAKGLIAPEFLRAIGWVALRCLCLFSLYAIASGAEFLPTRQSRDQKSEGRAPQVPFSRLHGAPTEKVRDLRSASLRKFARENTDITWSKLPSLPNRYGFAGSFAGTHDGVLIVAGGANFPGKKPWEAGTKVWYDAVFALDNPNGQWRDAGKLPHPLGYGIALTTKDGIACIGGSDSQRHYAGAFLLRYSTGKVTVQELPALPRPCANFSGAILANTIYAAGGTEKPDATQALKTFWSLDLAEPGAAWRELDPWPGPERMLASVGARDGSVFLFGGAALKAGTDSKPKREWLRDGYRFTPGKGWKQIADLPRAAVGAPAPVPASGKSHLLLLGGDDGMQVDAPPAEHQGFPREILAYDTLTDRWTALGQVPFSLVTTPAVEWKGHIVIPGGETRPGVRSPEVWWGSRR